VIEMINRFLTRARVSVTLALSLLLVASGAASVPQKMKPEELVAKHLDAVGPADARSALKTIVSSGTVEMTLRGRGTSKMTGTAAFASDAGKNLLSLVFENPDYPFERIGFNGQRVVGAEIKPGQRTPLINFLLANNEVISQGLVGGVLSTAWPLRNLAEKNPKLEYGGSKKIAGKQVHELKYLPRKGSDLRISLFFDAETFQHVRTEYRRSIAGQMGSTPDTSASAGTETRYKMVEEFSDFKAEGKLVLPHSYKLSLEVATPNETRAFEWDTRLTQFVFDREIAEKEFSVTVAN
jgi:hypothetical protein